MLYEQAHCKREKEHRRNLKHETDGKCNLVRLTDRCRSVQDVGNVKCVESGAAAACLGSRTVAGSHQPDGSCESLGERSAASRRTSSRSHQRSSSQRAKDDSKTAKNDAAVAAAAGTASGAGKCFEQPAKRTHEPCDSDFKWQHAEYARDECGSGIRPLKMTFAPNRRTWCTTPLSMYQSTIGELARRILCNELKVRRNVNEAPPCNVCEYALPLCRGYYRKYDCARSCEQRMAAHKDGKKVYRDRVQRYWEPCLADEQKPRSSVRQYASHNAYLGAFVRRKFQDSVPCW